MNGLHAARDNAEPLRLHRAALVGEFAHTLSHDFAVLLSGLLAQTDHAAAGQDPALWHQALKQNLGTATRMEQLAARFRHAASLLDIERNRADLKELAATALQALSHHTRAKHMQVVSELWDPLPLEQPAGECFHLLCASLLLLLHAASAGSMLTVKADGPAAGRSALALTLQLAPAPAKFEPPHPADPATLLAAKLGIELRATQDAHSATLTLHCNRPAPTEVS